MINCFRFLGFDNLYDINTLTLYEYEARMYAFKLRQVDDDLKAHKQAWLNHRVTATNDKGKSVYKNFKDFFDYEKELKSVEAQKSQLSEDKKRLARIAKKVNERR